MFNFFAKKYPETTEDMCKTYIQFSAGRTPKDALTKTCGIFMKKSELLSHMSPEEYLTGVFHHEYTNMPNTYGQARPFVKRVIVNLISAYLHPECSGMRNMGNPDPNNPYKHMNAIVNNYII